MAGKFQFSTDFERALLKKGYKGYGVPGKGWEPFAVFKPLTAERVREYSIGISPQTKDVINIAKLNTELEADARKLFNDVNMNITDFHPAYGIYGKSVESSPRFTLDYGGDYTALRDKVASLAEKYKQDSALISKKAFSGEKGSPSAMLYFQKNLSPADRQSIQRMVTLRNLGANINNKSVLIHHVDQFTDMSPEEFEHVVREMSDNLDKKMPHSLQKNDYIQDIIWGKRKAKR